MLPTLVALILPNTVTEKQLTMDWLAIIKFWFKRISSTKALTIEEYQAYIRVPLMVSKRVSKAFQDANICNCTPEELAAHGRAHKYVHLISQCCIAKCDGTDCTDGIQNHHQRNAPYERIKQENLALPGG